MAVITSPQEYAAAQAELRSLEQWLTSTHQEHPNPEKGYTKVGIRKMIARIHEELGQYEAQLAVGAASGNVEPSNVT
jgi:hypothetical protein